MMMLRYVCMNDSTHSFKGRNRDGATCPVCGGQVLPNYFDKQVHNTLPDYMTMKVVAEGTRQLSEEIKIIIQIAPDADIAEEKRKLSVEIRSQIRNILLNL